MRRNFYIPNDILTEILLRLPIKSLLRFQAVRKHWLSLVTSSDFVDSHLQRSPKHAVGRTSSLSYTEYGISFLRAGTIGLEGHNIPVSSMINEETSYADFAGTSNGLLCVYVESINSKGYFLWNPATRKHRQLPPPVEVNFRPNGSAFGFHPETRDYKLIIVDHFCLNSEGLYKAEVFTLSTRSWKQVKGIRTSEYWELIYRRSVVIRGIWYHLCFDCKKNIGKVPSILSFDMGNDAFSEMEVWLPYDSVADLNFNLMDYKESLAMSVKSKKESTLELEIWVMKQNECWIKLSAFSRSLPKNMNIFPLGIGIDKEIIIGVLNNEQQCYERLEFCDLLTEETNMVLLNKDRRFYGAYNYVESLVSVYGTNTGGDQLAEQYDMRG